MSAIHVVLLGSSSVVGTNLASPTTERYAALHQTWLRANRKAPTPAQAHCRVTVVGLAALSYYEQQATGYSTPANRVAVAPVNTSNNITTALALRPDVVVVHQPAGQLGDFQASWGCSSVADFEGAVDNEVIPLIANLRTACLNQGVGFMLLGAHPLSAASKITNSASDAQMTGRHYYNTQAKAWAAGLGVPFVDYWDSVAVGTGYNNPAHEIAPVFNGGDLAASKLLTDGVHMNATFLSATFEPSYVRLLGLDSFRSRRNAMDIV